MDQGKEVVTALRSSNARGFADVLIERGAEVLIEETPYSAFDPPPESDGDLPQVR